MRANACFDYPVRQSATSSASRVLVVRTPVSGEPISPELALVDPDLARRARAVLPDPGSLAAQARQVRRRPRRPETGIHAGRGAARAVAASPGTEAPSIRGTGPLQQRRRGTRSARRWLLAGALYVVVPVTAVGAVTYLDDIATGEEIRFKAGDRPSLRRTVPETHEVLAPKSVPRAATPVATPRAGGDDRPSAGKSTSSPRPGETRQRDEASPVSKAETVLVWLPVEGAGHYRVALYRGGAKIFESVTEGPRIALQAVWRFQSKRYRLEPGVYRWTVRPVTGEGSAAVIGGPVVDSTWVVRPRDR
jgi:hypothetical protein